MSAQSPAVSERFTHATQRTHVREVPILDDDFALGFESADPSLQIDSWSPDEDFAESRGFY
jgi:hypothetical protein